MIDTPKILTRGKITYYIYNETIIVYVGGNQWIAYDQYNNWNRQGITKFANIILKSKDNEYANAVDQMSLAVQCGIKGVSARKPKEAM